MKICLKTQARQMNAEHVVVELIERLPVSVSSPCQLTCDFQVEAHADYYLLTLNVRGTMMVTCQRCLGAFQHDYHNQTVLAVCRDEAIAESLMEHYECTVAFNNEVELTDILTDELHLFLPEKHANLDDCDREMSQLIGTNI